jgi:uroporphyrinogen decarboxylase
MWRYNHTGQLIAPDAPFESTLDCRAAGPPAKSVLPRRVNNPLPLMVAGLCAKNKRSHRQCHRDPMTKREVIHDVLSGGKPPYVPWSMGFTKEAREKLQTHFGTDDLDRPLDNHLVKLGSDIGFFEDVGDNRVRDVFGVTWDRTVDKDIGNVEGCVLGRPALDGYEFPDPLDSRFFETIPERVAACPDGFRVFQIGFSLYERAWTLRGMANLMMDFHDHPGFVHELFGRIADYNIAQVHKALEFDIDAVYFGDDWGQQQGLQMGPKLWHEFIFPVLCRMYGVVRGAGKFVMIHSCGDVDELFDDLIAAGINCFNPFQPEVMDVCGLLPAYRGRLAFHGGLSTQKTLPFGTVDQVRAEVGRLLELGREGGYIFAPAHDVEGDVPLENMLAAIELVQQQPGYLAAKQCQP